MAREALEACEAAIMPGKPMGDVFAAHAQIFGKAGLGHARLNACGYAMGAIYNPIWADFPMFYENNPRLMRERQVFFLHMILMDSDSGLAMCLGHSVEVTAQGAKTPVTPCARFVRIIGFSRDRVHSGLLPKHR